MKRRNQYLMESYKEKFGYTCMNPECQSGFNIETHHIIPLYKNGIDEESNYIVLCFLCYRLARRHSKTEEQEIILATWKYYYESLFDASLQGNEIANEKVKNLQSIHRIAIPNE